MNNYILKVQARKFALKLIDEKVAALNSNDNNRTQRIKKIIPRAFERYKRRVDACTNSIPQ